MNERADTHHDAERAHELEDLHLPDKPDGPAAAATLAAGIGIFALGLFTVLSEAWVAFHDFVGDLEFGRGVGPLAGKTLLAVAVWLVAWAILAMLWRRKDVNLRSAFWVGMALGILGAVGTFPTFFTLFAAE